MQKIKEGNAFELPITPIDFIGSKSTNFWRFVSEILHVNIHIYDKRVDNLQNASTIMTGSLGRMNSKNKDFLQENQSQKSSKKRK